VSLPFVKLFSCITTSTIWCESERTRLVWITMLALSDSRGRVWASIPGLANAARVPVEDCQIAIDTLLAPDRYSRSKEHDGRRIEEIDGGWQILNYIKFRELKDSEQEKEHKREYMRKRRAMERKTLTVKADTVNLVGKKVE